MNSKPNIDLTLSRLVHYIFLMQKRWFVTEKNITKGDYKKRKTRLYCHSWRWSNQKFKGFLPAIRPFTRLHPPYRKNRTMFRGPFLNIFPFFFPVPLI